MVRSLLHSDVFGSSEEPILRSWRIQNVTFGSLLYVEVGSQHGQGPNSQQIRAVLVVHILYQAHWGHARSVHHQLSTPASTFPNQLYPLHQASFNPTTSDQYTLFNSMAFALPTMLFSLGLWHFGIAFTLSNSRVSGVKKVNKWQWILGHESKTRLLVTTQSRHEVNDHDGDGDDAKSNFDYWGNYVQTLPKYAHIKRTHTFDIGKLKTNKTFAVSGSRNDSVWSDWLWSSKMCLRWKYVGHGFSGKQLLLNNMSNLAFVF